MAGVAKQSGLSSHSLNDQNSTLDSTDAVFRVPCFKKLRSGKGSLRHQASGISHNRDAKGEVICEKLETLCSSGSEAEYGC
jgi:hypothetical protein